MSSALLLIAYQNKRGVRKWTPPCFWSHRYTPREHIGIDDALTDERPIGDGTQPCSRSPHAAYLFFLWTGLPCHSSSSVRPRAGSHNSPPVVGLPRSCLAC